MCTEFKDSQDCKHHAKPQQTTQAKHRLATEAMKGSILTLVQLGHHLRQQEKNMKRWRQIEKMTETKLHTLIMCLLFFRKHQKWQHLTLNCDRNLMHLHEVWAHGLCVQTALWDENWGWDELTNSEQKAVMLQKKKNKKNNTSWVHSRTRRMQLKSSTTAH